MDQIDVAVNLRFAVERMGIHRAPAHAALRMRSSRMRRLAQSVTPQLGHWLKARPALSTVQQPIPRPPQTKHLAGGGALFARICVALTVLPFRRCRCAGATCAPT